MCKPFLTSLTAGYILKNPIDQRINFNIPDSNGKNKTWVEVHPNLEIFGEVFRQSMNFNSGEETHDIKQVGGMTCPYAKKNKAFNIYKILNPWKITTPPGYSCLFVPPLNNSDDRFSIIPGIVQTDKHPIEVNFPFIINGDKYPILDTILKKGTPYVQVIPFKRESWKMKINDRNSTKNNFKWGFFNINNYKTNVWSRIKFN